MRSTRVRWLDAHRHPKYTNPKYTNPKYPPGPPAFKLYPLLLHFEVYTLTTTFIALWAPPKAGCDIALWAQPKAGWVAPAFSLKSADPVDL